MAAGGLGVGERARPECGPYAVDAVESALLAAAQQWMRDKDRSELRRTLLTLLVTIEATDNERA
jgi:hypothetical protein